MRELPDAAIRTFSTCVDERASGTPERGRRNDDARLRAEYGEARARARGDVRAEPGAPRVRHGVRTTRREPSGREERGSATPRSTAAAAPRTRQRIREWRKHHRQLWQAQGIPNR